LFFWIAIADLFLACELFVSGVLRTIHTSTYVFGSYDLTCALRGIETFFAAKTVCWTCIFSLHLVLCFHSHNKYSSPRLLLSIAFHLFTWVLPLVFTLLGFLFRASESSYCMAPIINPAWLAFLLATFLFNFVSYIYVLYRYYFALKMSPALRKLPSLQKSKLPLKLSLYLVAFLLIWAPNIAFTFYPLLWSSTCDFFWLDMIGLCTMSLSGALNCLAYGIANSAMRKNYTWAQFIGYFLVAPVLVIPLLIRNAYQKPIKELY